MKKSAIIYIFLGIGIGIILTTAIFYFNPTVEYKDYTDDEIVEKARELGMVFIKDSIEDRNDKASNTDKNNTQKEKIKLKIEAGDTLTTITNKLYKLEIIEDKEEFIKFARDKKIDKKLMPGAYELEVNLSYSTILNILSKGK